MKGRLILGLKTGWVVYFFFALSAENEEVLQAQDYRLRLLMYRGKDETGNFEVKFIWAGSGPA